MRRTSFKIECFVRHSVYVYFKFFIIINIIVVIIIFRGVFRSEGGYMVCVIEESVSNKWVFLHQRGFLKFCLGEVFASVSDSYPVMPIFVLRQSW